MNSGDARMVRNETIWGTPALWHNKASVAFWVPSARRACCAARARLHWGGRRGRQDLGLQAIVQALNSAVSFEVPPCRSASRRSSSPPQRPQASHAASSSSRATRVRGMRTRSLLQHAAGRDAPAGWGWTPCGLLEEGSAAASWRLERMAAVVRDGNFILLTWFLSFEVVSST